MLKFLKLAEQRGIILRRLALGIALILLPLALMAQAPGWWSNRGVTASGSNVTPNDYAAVNQGQAKNMAVQAVAELNADLPDSSGSNQANVGAGPVLNQLASQLSATTAHTNDYAPLNLGQLKALAQPFYDRLIAVGCTNQYPWIGSVNPPNDYAMANIGQLKNLFSFDLSGYDWTENTPPAWWLNDFFPNGTSLSGCDLAPCGVILNGTAITLLQAYQMGISPIDYYNGLLPTLSIAGGGDQRALSGVSSVPLSVSVNNGAQNAPVTFTVMSGDALISATNDDPSPSSTVQTRTSVASGTQQSVAQIYIYFPAPPGDLSIIQASATSGTSSMSICTTAVTSDPNIPPPSGFTAVPTSPTTVELEWTSSDASQSTTIQESLDGCATWFVATVTPPGVQTVTISGMTPDVTAFFRAITGDITSD